MQKVIDLFAGAGGFGLGFKLAKFELCCSLEIDHWAIETLRTNSPDDAIIIEDDIRCYQTKEQIFQACKGVFPDIIIGGPPCQGFSCAGPSHKEKSKDPRNSLFNDFARWVKYLEPSIFIMENVKGILSRVNANKEKIINIIKETFDRLDYTVEIWKLNAAEYGVPQMRERVFIVGNRFGKIITPPPTTHYLAELNSNEEQSDSIIIADKSRSIWVWEAISDIPVIKAWEGNEEQPYTKEPETNFQKWARGEQQTLYNHVAMKHSNRMIERFKQIKWRQSASDTPKEHRARKRNGNGEVSDVFYNSNNRRLYPHSPSYTIPAQFYSSFIHPYQHRNITAREAARLQSFPDWYRFMGKRTVISRKLLERYGRHEDNYLSQYNQIGNAVPPLLAKKIAEHFQKVFEKQ